jgi:hypothetical protein
LPGLVDEFEVAALVAPEDLDAAAVGMCSASICR